MLIGIIILLTGRWFLFVAVTMVRNGVFPMPDVAFLLRSSGRDLHACSSHTLERQYA